MLALSDDLIAQLTSIDTPTVCNALEILVPGRRAEGFTTRPLVCTSPEQAPVVGVARTATIRATRPGGDAAELASARDAYYAYIDAGAKPSVVVIEDLDDEPGYGSFWGEVNSNIHLGLGCRAVVTNGSVRDLPDLADGFQVLADRVGPSHAHVHVVDHGMPVAVAGMYVSDGDLIHLDPHGAVVIPDAVAGDVAAAAELIARRERVIIEAARQPGFDIAELRRAQVKSARI